MESLLVVAALAILAVPVLLIVLLVSVGALRRRVADLETQVSWLRHHAAEAASAPRAPRTDATDASEPTLSELLRQSSAARPSTSAAPSSPQPEASEPVASSPVQARPATPSAAAVPPPLPPASPAPTPAPARAAAPSSTSTSGPAPAAAPRPRSAYARPTRGDGLFDTVRRWFTEGNVPVKVGVLVLFAGVAALLKYAVDQGRLQVPIELRLAGVALAAIGGLLFGWRQRDARRPFGLALQGGAIGVLLLVTFAAFKLYHFISPGAAFGISVALVAGLCVLAVRQESLALAVLGVLAGFLAPIWLSTGQGNHVALFGYYAVLNGGIVAMAWRRPWRLLNLLGFAFTFGVGSLWGALKYRPEDFASTEPFLLLFCAMYIAIPILYAAAKTPPQRRVFDGSLIFGTPLVAFTLQAAMLHDDRMLLAFCALGLGLLYAALAGLLRRRDTFAELVAPYAVLAVGFSTLAVPLALSARATAAVFALEGAGLVWLGLRQSRALPQLAGVGLQAAAALAFAYAFRPDIGGPPVLNGVVMTAVLVAIGGFATAFAARLYRSDALATGAYLWGLAWWLGAGLWEIDRSVEPRHAVDVVMLFVLGTGLLAAEVARRRAAGALHMTMAGSLLMPIVFAAWQFQNRGQPFAGLGSVAWAVDLIVAWRVLTCLRDNTSRIRGLTHIGWLMSLALVSSFAALHVMRHANVGDAWRFAAAALPWVVLAAVALLRPHRIAAPFGDDFDAWSGNLQAALATVLAGFFVVGLVWEGAMSPLPYVPLLDPVELVQIAGLLLALRAAGDVAIARPLLAGAAFVLATSIVLRATHHWGGMPWSPSMFSAGLVQTALTVLWSVIGMAAWVMGSRRQRRSLWQVGAVLMGVVLVKLVLVDRQYLGNLLGIGSFIAFGLLCTAVGYLAPVPPRDTEATA
ncbi:DUF2339 domain-containing protein [Cognatilysobacter terrigena]|uniref:DUF2339 domain-containing protein n=1 Tax=Cognatilysobacter terrigena TaxID=2488749 RepID=UPI00105F711D|nr:DUF2339 domain-containing protein [Lysobacter terrigena]